MQAHDEHDWHSEPAPSGAVPPAWLRHSRISLPPTPESTKTARDFTVMTLRGWYLDPLINDTVLVASELVANAIRHGTSRAGLPAGAAAALAITTDGPAVSLSWRCQPGSLICTVTDQSVRPPVLTEPDFESESGRGLQVVHSLAANWGWTPLGSRGKAVWAAFQLPGTDGTATPLTAPGLVLLPDMMPL